MLCRFWVLLSALLLQASISTAQNCAVNAGPDQTICVTSPLTLTSVAGNPQSAPPLYQWSKLSGPAVTITSPNAATTTVTGLTPGNYVFEIASRCADFIFAKDLINVTVLPQPPTSIAGADITQCTNAPAPLNANAVTAPNIGTWTVSPAGGTFSPNANAPNATYTPPAGAATYTLTWTISNGYCQTSDALLLNILSPATVNAGADISLSCAGNCTPLNGSNPGLAPQQSGFWTVISGPNTPVFANPTTRNTTVCGLIPGSYTLRWTVSGPCLSGTDDVVITVINTFNPPVAQGAQPYINFCSTPAVTSQTLTSTPLAGGETGLWTQTSPASPVATFSPNNTVANVTVGNLTGTFPYIFTYVRTNAAGCTASTTHTISRIVQVLNLSNPTDLELACDATSTPVTISYDNISGVTTAITRTGVRISGPAAVGTISYSTSATAGSTRTDTWTASGMTTAGTYIFRLQYANSCGSQYRDVSITVSTTPGIVAAGSNPVLPCNTLNANPIGTAAAPGVYTWTQVSGPNTATLSGINTLSLNMSGLTQGTYNMRLSISGGKTCPAKYDTMSVKVTTAAPGLATAGADETVCAGNIRLAGNTPTPEQTGTWTATPSAGINFLPNSNAPNAIATGMAVSTVYTFRWTVSNACGSIFDEKIVTTTAVQSPPVPDAGAAICAPSGSTSTTLNGNAPGAATILWTALSPGSSVAPNTSQAPTASFTGGAGTYLFEYKLSVAGCTALMDTAFVTINQNIVANAGADIDICAPALPATTTLTGTTAPAGTTASWTQLAGPATVGIAAPNSSSTGVSGLQPGIYEFEYRIKNGGVCPDVTDNITVRVVSEPSAAAAGADQSVCDVTAATSVILNAVAPLVGTGYWQVVTGPPGSTPVFSNALLNTSTISGLTNGSYTLRWTTTNGAGCADKTDDMVLSISATANAGADINLCNAPNTNLNGNTNTTGTWALVSVSPGVSITSNAPNTAVVSGLTSPGPLPNIYTFKYSIPLTGGCPATNDDVTVTVYPTPSTADAGLDREICFNTNTITLTGSTPAIGLGSWTRDSGPNNPTAGANNNIFMDTTLNNLQAGQYFYTYKVNTNAVCTASADQVSIVKERTAAAGADIQVCNSTSINLSGNAGVINAGTWSYVSGPAGASITNANAPNTSVTGLVPGTYIFRWTIGSLAALGCTANSDDVQVKIDAPVPAMNAGADVVFCEGSVSPFTIGSLAQIGVSYTWTPSLLLDNANISQPTFSGVNNPGTYFYSVKGTNGTCEAFDAMSIKVNPKPAAALNFNSSGCSSVIFSGTNLFPAVSITNYSWNFGSGASTPAATGAGPHTISYTGAGIKTITLTTTTADGCIATVSKQINNGCFSLPIDLRSFTATWQQNFTLLKWEVQSALSFDKFEIERSFDGINYKATGQIKFDYNLQTYFFEDKNIPVAATNIYYRLKLIDTDGRFSYSSIVTIQINLNSSAINLFPNPASSLVHLQLGAAAKGDYHLALIDALGRSIQTKQIKNAQPNQVVDLQRGGAPNGIYLIKITTLQKNETTWKQLIFE